VPRRRVIGDNTGYRPTGSPDASRGRTGVDDKAHINLINEAETEVVERELYMLSSAEDLRGLQ
jgi:hypothetical protein